MKKQKLKRAQYTPPQAEVAAIIETNVICTSVEIDKPNRKDEQDW